MTVLNGWITLDHGSWQSSEFDQWVESVKNNGADMNVSTINATQNIRFFSCRNHFGTPAKTIIDFFFWVSQYVDTEAYGLLYIYDEEGLNDHSDKFQVFRLAKNQVSQVEDPFFSPYSEKIADYEED
ncbi:MAG: Imm7 family immunity protein [Fluviicola sp.]|nr:Imm7 family immunity protein [Fluviicola sp.]